MEAIKGVIPQISNLTADVWISEEHGRELEITENPIEYGAPTTDHAFLLPQELTVEFGVTNSPIQANEVFGVYGVNRIENARKTLFQLQGSRVFLTAQTITGGKYERLLIKKIGWRTDSSNPNSITFVLALKEVIVTTTQTTTYSPLPAEKRAKNQTSKTVKTGEKSSKTLSTTDKTASVQDKAKAQAAKKQGDEVKKDNRTAAAKLADSLGI